MSVETLPLQLGPDANGMLITPDEFDAAEGEAGWRYELIRGVLIVTPAPLEEERDPNEELGRILRNYQEQHPAGKALDKTLHEHEIAVGDDRHPGILDYRSFPAHDDGALQTRERLRFEGRPRARNLRDATAAWIRAATRAAVRSGGCLG